MKRKDCSKWGGSLYVCSQRQKIVVLIEEIGQSQGGARKGEGK